MKTGKLIGIFCLALILFAGSAYAETVESVTSAETYTPNTYEPDPWISGNVTITNYLSTYKDTGIFTYENDGGDEQTLPFVVDSNVTNPIFVDVSKFVSPNGLQANIVDSSTNGTNWLNASNWNTGGGLASKLAVSTVKENGVEKLKIVFSGNASSGWGTTDLYLNEDITDLTKKYFTVGMEVSGFDANNTLWLELRDTDGDYTKYVYSTSDTEIISIKISDATVVTVGDGVMSAIDYINFEFQDKDTETANGFTLKFYGIAIQIKPWSFGLDNAGESVTDVSADGYANVKTFSPSFKYDSVAELGPIAFHAPASKLAAKYTNVSVADYTISDYVKKVFYDFSMNVPDAIDLTYAGLMLEDVLTINSQQYDYVSANAVQKSGLFTGARKGDTVTVLDSVSEGTQYPMEYEILFTKDQWEGISEQVGALTSDSSAWWNEWWLWFASLVGIGYGVKRKRKNA